MENEIKEKEISILFGKYKARGYKVTSDGKFFSCRGVKGIGWGKGDKGGTVSILSDEWREVKGSLVYGYRKVCLYTDEGPKSFFLHRIVLECFKGSSPSKGMICRHLDGNPLNNHIDNLAWGTPKENAEDAMKHGVLRKGESNGGSKLSNTDVLWIKNLSLLGWSRWKRAKMFGVTLRTITLIDEGKLWSSITKSTS